MNIALNTQILLTSPVVLLSLLPLALRNSLLELPLSITKTLQTLKTPHTLYSFQKQNYIKLKFSLSTKSTKKVDKN